MAFMGGLESVLSSLMTSPSPHSVSRAAGTAFAADALQIRDSEQGPPRSEAVVPLKGEGAEGDSGGVHYQETTWPISNGTTPSTSTSS
jgi:hypothetical protein